MCSLIFFFIIFASFKNKAYLCSDKYVKPFNSKYYAEQREKKKNECDNEQQRQVPQPLLENNVPLEVIVKSLGLTDQEAATLRS